MKRIDCLKFLKIGEKAFCDEALNANFFGCFVYFSRPFLYKYKTLIYEIQFTHVCH